jgi:DNA-binding GntR family transcriptional regulator
MHAAADTVAPLQVKELVYQRMRDALTENEFVPGESLREVALSARYGVSKTPIREALVRLEHDGLVEIVPYRGARARVYSADDARELFEVRELFESECVRIAASRPDIVATLADNVRRTREALAVGSLVRAARHLDEFDEILFQALDNRLLAGVVEQLELHLRRIGAMGAGKRRFEESVEQHGAVVAALHDGRTDDALEVMRSHLLSVREVQVAALGDLAATEQ